MIMVNLESDAWSVPPHFGEAGKVYFRVLQGLGRCTLRSGTATHGAPPVNFELRGRRSGSSPVPTLRIW